MKANDLKPGKAIVQDGQVWIVTKTEHVKPGKGGAFVQAKVKSMKTGSVQEKRFRSSDDVDGINLDRREMEYLYSDGSGAIFMDSETFDQVTLPEDILGDALKFLKPNEKISGLHHDGQCLSVELPQTVDLEVTDTPPGIKNATATSVMKEATTETGLVVKVPEFIGVGDVIRVNTESGDYQSRA
ncbi:elongation factor P [Phycisphaeraceae bacterium D3-23]